MSSARSPRFWHLLAFRLTLWYGGVLAVSAVACWLLFYWISLSSMRARADADLLRESLRCSEALRTGGMPSLQKQIDTVTRSAGVNDMFFRVFDQSGQTIATSDLAGWGDTKFPPHDLGSDPDDSPRFEEAAGVGHHQKVRVLTLRIEGGDVIQSGISFFQIGMSTQDDQLVLARARREVILIFVGMLALATAVGWLLARRALAGVQHLTMAANEVSRGALERRVPLSGSGNEIDQLAATFNRMLERIQTLVEGMQKTNDNIAHELRSPVTRIRGLAETTLTGRCSQRQFEEMAASNVEECDRLLSMINTMLDISEAEAGVMPLNLQPVEVVALLRAAAELYEPLAAENEQSLVVDSPQTAVVRGDLQRLQRVVANLLDNAVKYTPREGRITLSIRIADGTVAITVANPGRGISSDDLPHVFDRFFRSDRSRSTPGNGLGLSLAQAIVHAHGGQITASSKKDLETRFTIVLPTAEGSVVAERAKITN